jgi:thymidylate synthase
MSDHVERATDRKAGGGGTSDNDSTAVVVDTSTNATPKQVTPEQQHAASNGGSSVLSDQTFSKVSRHLQDVNSKHPKRTPISLFSKGDDEDDKYQEASTVLLEHKSNKRPRHSIEDSLVIDRKLSATFTQNSFDTAELAGFSQDSEAEPVFSQATVPVDYTPMSQTNEEDFESFYLIDCESKKAKPLTNGLERSHNGDDDHDDKYTEFTMGRDRASNVIELKHASIGNRHAKLVYDCTTHAWTLNAISNTCWMLQSGTGKWMGILAGDSQSLPVHGTFRLVAPSTLKSKQTDVQFTLGRCVHTGNEPRAGSRSFDDAYLELLRRIETDGHMQTNKKGPSKTLREPHTLHIDLHSDDPDTNLLPISTLRKMYGGQMAIYEALWYIRGEDHTNFLRQHGCKFWDAQAENGGFVGLSYGLLTNFPDDHNGSGCGRRNQLLEKVIEPLCAGKCSRNMNVTLCKPGERTVQEACTSGLQFSVGAGELLDLTVIQRSSDTILGLPNDVMVWSVILHLVRREVRLRSGRKLAAGKLHFTILAGGAHIYAKNHSNCARLLKRQPFAGQQPHMVIDVNDDTDIFALAHNYEKGQLRVEGYTQYHDGMKIQQAL